MNQHNNHWTEKYWDHMANENFDEAIPLKLSNFPGAFYKYRALKETTLDSLEQNYIWLAEISTLNDPFECSIQFDNDECLRLFFNSPEFQANFRLLTGHILTQQEINALIKSKKPFDEYIKLCRNKNIPFGLTPEQQLAKVQNRWSEIVNETNCNLRICSFSTINSSLLLWSHYSDEHKGICIEYDFLDEDPIRTFIQPVIYRDKIHKIQLFEEYTTIQMIASSLIKSKDWKYEEEWRLTIFRQKEKFPQKMKTPIPKAIYLGTRFSLNPDRLKQRLLKIAKDYKIPLFHMVKDPNSFKLVRGQSLNR